MLEMFFYWCNSGLGAIGTGGLGLGVRFLLMPFMHLSGNMQKKVARVLLAADAIVSIAITYIAKSQVQKTMLEILENAKK
jgi:hypothetical protein